MKVKISGWIVRHQPPYLNEPSWIFDQYGKPPKHDDDNVPVCEHTIEVEVPDHDFVPERVAGVRMEIQRTYARAETQVQELREVESKLLALTNEVQS